MTKKQQAADYYAYAIHEALRKMLEIVAPGWRVEHVGFDEKGVALHIYTPEGVNLSVGQDVGD